MSPRFHYRLTAPVILVTKGRGREVFTDSAKLFARLQELPALGEKVMSIQQGTKGAVSEDGIDAFEVFLEIEGWSYFKRAALRRREREGDPVQRFGTRWNWAYLSDYLGWDWRPL